MLNQGPFDDELMAFGLPWHGLVTAPKGAAAYIELSSGRKIYADGLGVQGKNTFLIDHDLPLPAVELPDPEAALWSRYIAVRQHVDGNELAAWAGLAGAGSGVMVPTAGGWQRWYATPVLFDAVRVTVMSSIAGIQRFITFAELGIPSDLIQWYSQILLDVSRDGRRWIYGFYRVNPASTAVQIQIDGSENTGLLAVYEVAANADLTDFSVSVLATYEQCREGVETARVDGSPYEHLIMWRTMSGGVQVGAEIVPAGTPPPHPVCSGSAADPCSDGVLFSSGTSQSQITREFVVGAWYDAAGAPRLAKVAVSWTVTGVSTTPEPGPGGFYWQNYTRTVEVTATSATGGSSQQMLSVVGVETTSPAGFTASVDIGGNQYHRSSPSVDYGQHQSGGHIPPENAENYITYDAALTYIWQSGFSSGPYIEVRGVLAGWTSSNKVLGSMFRVWEDGTSQEFIAGPALTPAGVDPGYKTSGNIFGGHNTGYEPFNEALWDQHAWFANGIYNPVTGQVLRNERGPTFYSWV